MVENLIARLDRWLAANRPDYYSLLQPGATDAELDAFDAQFSLKLPAPFRQLYRWRSGQDPMRSGLLQGNRSFCTLGEITESKEELDDLIDSDFEDPRYWRRGWVPFLHNGGGSYLCLDVAAELDSQQLHSLAQALEDAGCADPQVLAHCRAPVRHVRGCWVLDLVLERK